jgi:hypothetical protein
VGQVCQLANRQWVVPILTTSSGLPNIDMLFQRSQLVNINEYSMRQLTRPPDRREAARVPKKIITEVEKNPEAKWAKQGTHRHVFRSAAAFRNVCDCEVSDVDLFMSARAGLALRLEANHTETLATDGCSDDTLRRACAKLASKKPTNLSHSRTIVFTKP